MADPQLPRGYVLDNPEPKLPEGYVWDKPYKDPITKMLETVVPLAGRLGAEALPAIGSFFGPGGTLIGIGISQRLKSLKPELFGEQPQGLDAVANAGKELVLNNLLP